MNSIFAVYLPFSLFVKNTVWNHYLMLLLHMLGLWVASTHKLEDTGFQVNIWNILEELYLQYHSWRALSETGSDLNDKILASSWCHRDLGGKWQLYFPCGRNKNCFGQKADYSNLHFPKMATTFISFVHLQHDLDHSLYPLTLNLGRSNFLVTKRMRQKG